MNNISQLSKKHSQIFQLSDNDRPGAWCWFHDQRTIIDNHNPNKPILLTSVVTYGDSSSFKRGDIDMYWANLNPTSLNPITPVLVDMQR